MTTHPQLWFIIVQTLVCLILIVINYLMWRKYLVKPNESVLYLTLSMNGYLMASILSFTGTLLDYLSIHPPVGIYATLFDSVGLVFLLGSNYCLMGFITTIFFENNKLLMNGSGLVVGLSIGLLISEFSMVDDNSVAPSFFIGFVFIILVNLLMATLCIKETRIAGEDEVRLGFMLLAASGVFALLTFFFFVLTVTVGRNYDGYHATGWIIAIFSSLVTYMGIFRPKILYNLLIKTDE
ncbi:MAG: hypothetical protein OEZ01_18375 [Candidatus Heimdallarchaeota archaeon]|nr:hypothetical protein [Candidatus Heimdallarchaeota archaeon]